MYHAKIIIIIILIIFHFLALIYREFFWKGKLTGEKPKRDLFLGSSNGRVFRKFDNRPPRKKIFDLKKTHRFWTFREGSCNHRCIMPKIIIIITITLHMLTRK